MSAVATCFSYLFITAGKRRSSEWRWFARSCGLAIILVLVTGVSVQAQKHHTLRFFTRSSKPQSGESLAFSPNNQELALVTDAGTTLIRVADAQQIASVKVNGKTIGYSSDGQSLLLLSEIVSRLNCATRQVEALKYAAPPPGYVGLKVTQKNGKNVVEQILAGSPAERDGRIKVGDEIVAIGRDRGNKPKSVLGNPIQQVVAALGGPPATAVELFFVHEGDSETIAVRLIRDLIRQQEGKTEFYAAGLQSPEPSLVCSVRDGRCDLVRPTNSRFATIVPTEHLPSVRSAALAPDGQHVVVVGFLANGRLGVECVDAINNKTTSFYDLPDKQSYDLVFTADGKFLLTLSSTRIVKLDLSNQAQPVLLNQEGILDSQSFPGAYSVGGYQLDQAFNFNAFGGGLKWQIVRSNQLKPQSLSALLEKVRTLTRMAVSQTGVLAIGTAEGDVYLLDVETGSSIRQFGKKGDGNVELVEFSPDGRWLGYYVSGTLHIVDVSGVRDAAADAGKLDHVDASASGQQYTLSSAEGAFTATFPGKPEYDANQHKYEVQQNNGKVKYAVVCMDVGPKLIERTKDPAALRDLYDTVGSSFAKHTKGRIEETVDHDTKPIVERSIRWTFPQGGKDWQTHARLTAHGTRLYILSVTHEPSEAVAKEQIEQFFSTFKARDTDK